MPLRVQFISEPCKVYTMATKVRRLIKLTDVSFIEGASCVCVVSSSISKEFIIYCYTSMQIILNLPV
jgi:hypothetical protein